MTTTTAALNEHRPLAAYGTFATAFAAALAGTLVAIKASGRELPQRPAPRTTRFLAGIYTAETIADFLHFAHRAAQSRI